MTDVIATDLQGQQIESPIVDLFEVTLPSGSVVYFHPGKDDSLSDIQFKSKDANNSGNYTVNTYTAIPAALDGMEIQADGAISRPTISIANVGPTILANNPSLKYSDLVGQTVVKRQTLAKYLVGGSAYDSTATTPPMELASVKYKIDRVSSETNVAIVFELAVAYDLEGIQLPRRKVVGKYCSWMYQGLNIYGKGGCTASLDGEITYKAPGKGNTTKTTTILTDIDNNFLVRVSEIDFSTVASWLQNTPYTKDSNYVKTGSGASTRAWQCIQAHQSHPTDNHPVDSGVGSSYWAEIRPYADYANTGTYALGYLVKQTITLNSKTVTAIWECVLAHTSSSSTIPELGSPYWKRIDLCGKTLTSCKCKFNSLPKDRSVNGSLPSGNKSDAHPLPFGGFPSTGRF